MDVNRRKILFLSLVGCAVISLVAGTAYAEVLSNTAKPGTNSYTVYPTDTVYTYNAGEVTYGYLWENTFTANSSATAGTWNFYEVYSGGAIYANGSADTNVFYGPYYACPSNGSTCTRSLYDWCYALNVPVALGGNEDVYGGSISPSVPTYAEQYVYINPGSCPPTSSQFSVVEDISALYGQ